MDHETVLNLILSHACPSTLPDDDGKANYQIDTHCESFVVEAQLVSIYKTIQYKILNIRKA